MMNTDITKYKNFLDTINIPSLLCNEDGTIIYTSKDFPEKSISEKNIIDFAVNSSTEIYNICGKEYCFKRNTVEISNEKYILLIQDSTAEEIKNLKNIIADKDRFISVLAHDLISPLTGIIGFSDLITKEFKNLPASVNKTELSDNEKELIEIYMRISKRAALINTSTKEVYALLENLLEWTRSRKNKIEPFIENINLKDAIDEAVEYARSSADYKEIKIENNIKKDYRIAADKNILKTILRNFLSNAIKFTPRNGLVETTISETSKSDKKYIQISVSDNGVGIPERQLKKIFEDDVIFTTKGTESEKGTGVGLKLCRDFAKLLKGSVTIRSKRGSGTIVSLLLPME